MVDWQALLRTNSQSGFRVKSHLSSPMRWSLVILSIVWSKTHYQIPAVNKPLGDTVENVCVRVCTRRMCDFSARRHGCKFMFVSVCMRISFHCAAQRRTWPLSLEKHVASWVPRVLMRDVLHFNQHCVSQSQSGVLWISRSAVNNLHRTKNNRLRYKLGFKLHYGLLMPLSGEKLYFFPTLWLLNVSMQR